MTLLQILQQAEVDTEKTLHRFNGNSSLLERFVKKFPQDPTYPCLLEAINAQDRPAIETAAHTLKGTAANLGFQVLSDHCAAVVAALREGAPLDALESLMQPVHEEYEKLLRLISSLE